MTAILEQIVALIARLQCFTVLTPDERGVLLRFGKIVGEVGPGLHWLWPVADSVETLSIVSQVEDLPARTLTTRDGRSVSVGLKIHYTVTQVPLALFAVYHVRDAIQDEASGALADEVSSRSWAQVIKDRREIQDEIQDALSEQAEAWGLHIEDVTINDLASARAIRLIQDSNYEE